ncbi:MAG: hypothetical protein Fur0034_18060 [Desulfuromonadia bacterium]
MATTHDLVLIHIDQKPAFFARIEDIVPDVKPGWWQVTLLALGIPLQLHTWILDTDQVAGAPFTMGGTPVRLEKVISPYTPPAPAESAPDETCEQQKRRDDPPPAERRKETGRILSIEELRKKR